MIDVGFAGVVGAQRIANGEMPYGHMPVQESRSRAAPPTPRVRSASGSGRTAAARPRTPAATRMGRSPTSPTCPDTPSLAGPGSGTNSGPRMRLRFSSTRSASSASHSWAGATAAHASPDARVRVGGVPLHPLRIELEHERRDHAGVPDLGLLARLVRLGSWRLRRAGGVDEVRSPAARAALAFVSSGFPASVRRFAFGSRPTVAAFLILLLKPEPLHRLCGRRAHIRLPARPRLAFLDLGLGPVPRGRHPRPARRPAGAASARRCRSGPVRLRAAPEIDPAVGRAHRRAPDRLRARADALVLSLHPVVFPFVAFALLYRRDRAAQVH